MDKYMVEVEIMVAKKISFEVMADNEDAIKERAKTLAWIAYSQNSNKLKPVSVEYKFLDIKQQSV
jgi:hypothetical protein